MWTLDIESLLEFLADLRRIDAITKFVDPLFDRTVYLVVSRVGFIERDRRVAGRGHCGH